jgi:hypothetical protein
MPMIAQGASGTLKFEATSAGLDPAVVTSTAWAPQGGQSAVKFTPPDKVEGLSAGSLKMKCTVTMGPGEKAVYDFTVDCYVPVPPQSGPPKTVPVSITYEEAQSANR